MIVLSRAITLSPAVAVADLFLPRIGYQTWLRGLTDAAVTASGAVDGAPKDAPLRPDTAEYWQPPALPATWQVDLGAGRDVDYVGIAGHTIGSSGASIKVEFSDDVQVPPPYVSIPGTSNNYVKTPDSALADVVGDIDLRVKIRSNDYDAGSGAVEALLAKFIGSGAQNSYRLALLNTGALRLSWSSDGTAILSADSTALVSSVFTDASDAWLRATLDVDNGAAGRDIKFWTSLDYDPQTGSGTWTQLGSTVTQGGTTAIFNSTTQVAAGANSDGTEPLGIHGGGRVYYAQVYAGIGGVLKVNMNPADGVHGGTSFLSSSTGETWTLNTSGVPAAALYNYTVGIISPGDDSSLLFMDTSRLRRYLKLTLAGAGAAPKIASVYAGQLLAMERGLALGFRPPTLSRRTTLKAPVSRGGQILMQSVRKHGLESEAQFSHLTQAWYRSYFDPFVKHARLGLPYFFAWNPQDFPLEVGYMWTEQDISPSYAQIDRFDVSWKMVGIGNE